MARRKKTKTGKARHRRSSRKMGGVKGPAMSAVGLIGGAIAANYVKNMIGDKLTFGGKEDPSKAKNYAGVAVLALGLFGPKFAKSPMLKSVFDGMIVSGGVSTLSTFVPQIPINGLDMIGRVDTIGAYTVGAVQSVNTIGESIENDSYNEYAY